MKRTGVLGGVLEDYRWRRWVLLHVLDLHGCWMKRRMIDNGGGEFVVLVIGSDGFDLWKRLSL